MSKKVKIFFLFIFLFPFFSLEAKDDKTRLSLGGGIYNFMEHGSDGYNQSSLAYNYELFSGKKERYETISGELGYPNEMVRGCLKMGLKVEGVSIANEQEMLGIKTPETLAAIREIVDGQK